MIDFQHNSVKLQPVLDIKNDCLNKVIKLNEEKNKILQDFIDEIEMRKDTDWDLGLEFQNRIMPKMASFGGQISGLTRLVKSELAKYVLGVLVDNNKNYFQQFTTMNFLVFSKYYLETSPTNKSILPLIDNSIPWKTKNINNPKFARKDKFLDYLDKFDIDKSGHFWGDWFNEEYSKYRELVKRDSDLSRNNLKLIKDNIK